MQHSRASKPECWWQAERALGALQQRRCSFASVTARHSSISKQRATQANPSPMQGRDVTVPRRKFVSRRLGRLRQLLVFFDLFLRNAEALREVDADELLTEVGR